MAQAGAVDGAGTEMSLVVASFDGQPLSNRGHISAEYTGPHAPALGAREKLALWAFQCLLPLLFFRAGTIHGTGGFVSTTAIMLLYSATFHWQGLLLSLCWLAVSAILHLLVRSFGRFLHWVTIRPCPLLCRRVLPQI
jgi:hypothetical protein